MLYLWNVLAPALLSPVLFMDIFADSFDISFDDDAYHAFAILGLLSGFPSWSYPQFFQ